MKFITLNNGIRCPVVGIGTYMLSPADAENSVREALKMGCSLVDTAKYRRSSSISTTGSCENRMVPDMLLLIPN